MQHARDEQAASANAGRLSRSVLGVTGRAQPRIPFGQLRIMSRASHLGITVGLVLFCCAWWVFGKVLWMSAAAGGASASDVSFIMGVIVWSGVQLGSLWGALVSLKRALRAPSRMPSTEVAVSASEPEQQRDLSTPDEKLAHLLRKPKDDTKT
jgi:hypothetical protein